MTTPFGSTPFDRRYPTAPARVERSNFGWFPACFCESIDCVAERSGPFAAAPAPERTNSAAAVAANADNAGSHLPNRMLLPSLQRRSGGGKLGAIVYLHSF